MIVPVLSALIALSAALNIRADLRGERRGVYLFKPLTTCLILALALALPEPVSASYRGLVAAGLLFSLAGDVFLMLPRDRFLAGLTSFLVAHLLYGGAFVGEADSPSAVAGAALLLYGAVLLARLWPALGKLRGPVAAYALVLLTMVWLAFTQWNGDLADRRGALVAAGGALFAFSDSVLACERFLARHRWGQAVVLSTYFAAQWLIALSVSAAW